MSGGELGSPHLICGGPTANMKLEGVGKTLSGVDLGAWGFISNLVLISMAFEWLRAVIFFHWLKNVSKNSGAFWTK